MVQICVEPCVGVRLLECLADMNNKECNCFIRHPISEEERKAVVDQLNYSRSIGDNVGILMATAALAGCPPLATRTRG